MDANQMSRHLARDRFGSFRLTAAIRPGLTHGVHPRQAYRIQTHRDGSRGHRLPVLTASVSREHLMDVFLALLEPLGPMVDIILESSHDQEIVDGLIESEREGIDLPILISHCLEFEDILLNDGCTGLAVLNEERKIEVHFDEHKLLYVYAPQLRPFEAILREHRIPRDDEMRILTEAEHIHCTHPHFEEEHRQFGYRLGVAELADQWL